MLTRRNFLLGLAAALAFAGAAAAEPLEILRISGLRVTDGASPGDVVVSYTVGPFSAYRGTVEATSAGGAVTTVAVGGGTSYAVPLRLAPGTTYTIAVKMYSPNTGRDHAETTHTTAK